MVFLIWFGIVRQTLVDGTVSLFGKVGLMEAKTKSIFNARSDGFADSDNFDVSFYHAMFAVGGKASVNFNIPNVWAWL